MARRFRRFVGAEPRIRWGMTFAEALIMIVVAGSLLIPVVGTLQTGIDRTNAYVHQDRMRTIAQASMTEILAGSAYARTPVVDFTATVTWPINDPEVVATYVMQVETLEGITLATLTSDVKGDFAGNEAMIGSQPANLKTVVVTVTRVPDPDDVGVEPAQVRLFSMVATPKSFNPNRIYIADKDNICIYAIDPLTKNVVETFDLPFSKTPKTKTENNPDRPGNIAVHPSSDWVLTQREKSLLLTNVGLFSATRRTSVVVYATSTSYLEKPNDNEAIRKDRGVVFRPDGRYCYVTSHSPAGLSIYSVPDTVVASFSLVKFLPISTAKFVDLQVGEDGYIYLGDYDNASKCFKRLNMFAPQNLVALEDYSLPGWLASTNKKAMAACTSRDGRRVYSVWEDAYIASSSSNNPADWGCAKISHPVNPSKEDIQDVQVSGDNRVVIATSKQGGGKTRIFAMPSELKAGTINVWTDPPNRVAYPGSGDITNQAVLSPAMNEVWVDRKGAGEIYALDTPGLLAGSYTTAIPTDRTVLFLPSGDAGCVAARMSEMVAVACDGPTKTIEFIDPWSKHHYENLTRKLVRYSKTPTHLAFNGAGSQLSVCYNASSTLPEVIDVFNGDVAPGVIDPESWGVTSDQPTHHVYFQNGGFLIQKQSSLMSANGYVSFNASGTKQADVDFPTTASMSDMIALPDGGALVLVTDFGATWTRLDWIGPDASVYAKWDSRFDAFPPPLSTRMAISPDGGLLAIYSANYNGATESVHVYDFRSRNFGTLTQQTGLICDYRSGSKIDFNGPVPSDVAMTGTTYKLKENFTCNDPVANMVDYPANFYWNTTSKYGGVRTTRFFGYLRIPEPVKAIGLALRDGGRFSLDGGTWFSHQFENSAGGVWAAAFDVPGLDPPAGPRVQFDKSTQGDNDLAMGPFFSLKAGADISGSGTADITCHGYTALGSSNGANWTRIPKTYTVPLRITPPHVLEWTNSPTNAGFNRFFLTFGRDVASSTLYLFNAETSLLYAVPMSGAVIPKPLVAGIAANTGQGLAITPDGQMLLIPAKNPSRVHLVDISIPARASYLSIIDGIDLPQTPVCIAARPFNRIASRKDVYDVVATFTVEPPTGSNIAAVATNGIYLLGGTAANQTDPLTTILRFNPSDNSIALLSKTLEKKAGAPAVVSYDDELLVFNGMEAVPTGWVQKYNPTTNTLITSADPPTPILNPVMTGYTTPAPYAVTKSSDSTTTTNEPAWRLFDGQEGNTSPPYTAWWAGSGKSANQWVQMDFGTPVIVNGFKVINFTAFGNYGAKDCKILGSNTNTWTTLNTDYFVIGTFTALNTSGWQSFGPWANMSAFQYYRFFVVNNYGSDGVCVVECKFLQTSIQPIGSFMSQTAADDNATVITRRNHAGCMTPYGPVIAGGYAPTTATRSVQVYWPHAVASFSFTGEAQTPVVPLIHLKFNETSGVTANDSSGNGKNGTLTTSTWTSGKFGNAVNINGGYVTIPSGTTIGFGTATSYTISAWVYLNANHNWARVCDFATNASTYGFLTTQSSFTGKPGFCVTNTAGGPAIDSSEPIPVGVWTHLAVTASGTDGKLYMNGVVVGTNPAMTVNLTHLGNCSNRIGKSVGAGEASLNGLIDDFRIFPAAMSQDEIQALIASRWLGISRDLAPMPGNRVNHSLVWHENKLYRVGGSDGTNILTTVDRFDPATNVWTELSAAADTDEFTDPAVLFKRQRAGACSFGDEIFIFGGENPVGTRLSTAAAWNPATRTVRRLKDLPLQTTWGFSEMALESYTPLGINAVPLGPYIYLLGGSNGTANGTSKQVLRYTP